MLAGAVNILALAGLAIAATSLQWFEEDERRNTLQLSAAIAGVAASIALVVSAIVLAEGWAAWFAHYNVAAFVPLDKWSRGGFPYIVVLSWPYEAMALGGFCFLVFARKLYRIAWIGGWI